MQISSGTLGTYWAAYAPSRRGGMLWFVKLWNGWREAKSRWMTPSRPSGRRTGMSDVRTELRTAQSHARAAERRQNGGVVLLEWSVTGLKPHPLNRKIYGDEAPPSDFIESVRRHGIMVPLAIKEDGTIISGHRRWQAALALKMEYVPVRVVRYADDLDEREAIIEFNRQREKTFSQKMAEAEELEAVERERA